ncbi:hypothetical protein Ancab_039036 [Ancistrocladus abbreviatus]
MATEDLETQNKVADEEEAATNTFFNRSNRCCFHFPCFGSHQNKRTIKLGSSSSASSTMSPFWDRVRAAENEDKWWARPLRAFKKLREWSEIIAGPKWKTFIRRFNRNRSAKHVKFQYDPLSYALNFDEGARQNADPDEDCSFYPNFTSRYVAVPVSSASKIPPAG